MGSRFKNKKAWKPLETTSSKSDEYHLLGNAAVDRWDKDDAVEEDRVAIVDVLQRADVQRKRKMHLDRHDAMLDQGKVRLQFDGERQTLRGADYVGLMLFSFACRQRKLRRRTKALCFQRPPRARNSNESKEMYSV
jgi:hypothetical protein